MDELDFLKKHWDKDTSYTKIKRAEIKSMLHKSSSSIVKWLLILCSIELLLGIALKTYSIVDDNYDTKISNWILEIIGTISTIVFLTLFVQEYLKIKTTINTKTLMNSILKTRNWVKLYIIVTIGLIFIQFIIGIMDFSHFEAFKEGYNDGYKMGAGDNIPPPEALLTDIDNTFLYIIFILTFLTIGGFIYLYYRLVYIRLIRKLKNNYDELVRLDEEKE